MKKEHSVLTTRKQVRAAWLSFRRECRKVRCEGRLQKAFHVPGTVEAGVDATWWRLWNDCKFCKRNQYARERNAALRELCGTSARAAREDMGL